MRELWAARIAKREAFDLEIARKRKLAVDAVAEGKRRKAANVNVSEVRTSSNCLLPHGTPTSHVVLAKVQRLASGKTRRCMESVQVARCETPPQTHCLLRSIDHPGPKPDSKLRYNAGEKYGGHYDGASPHEPSAWEFMSQGGQRLLTVLIYLNDVASGGATSFPLVPFEVRPRRGRAVIFCPGVLDGRLDPKLYHEARPAVDTKWVSQVWVRQFEDPMYCLPEDVRPTICGAESE